MHIRVPRFPRVRMQEDRQNGKITILPSHTPTITLIASSTDSGLWGIPDQSYAAGQLAPVPGTDLD